MRTILFPLLIILAACLCTCAFGDGFEELNYYRSQHGLPPLVEDPFLSECAQLKAEYLASHQIQGPRGWNGRQYDGHEGPTMGVGYVEGTGQLRPHEGWGTCASTVNGSYKAGTGVAVNKQDGLRYMCLIIEAGKVNRGGGVTATRDLPEKYAGRAVPAIPDANTSRLTPRPRSVQIITNRRIRPGQYWLGKLPQLIRNRRR